MPWAESKATKLNDHSVTVLVMMIPILDCFCLQPHKHFKDIQAGLVICKGNVPEEVA